MAKLLEGGPGVTIQLVQQGSGMHVERSILAPGSQIAEHSHQVASSYVVVSGRGKITGAHAREMGPGDAVLVDAKAKHGWENTGSDAFHIVGSFGAAS